MYRDELSHVSDKPSAHRSRRRRTNLRHHGLRLPGDDRAPGITVTGITVTGITRTITAASAPRRSLRPARSPCTGGAGDHDAGAHPRRTTGGRRGEEARRSRRSCHAGTRRTNDRPTDADAASTSMTIADAGATRRSPRSARSPSAGARDEATGVCPRTATRRPRGEVHRSGPRRRSAAV